MIDPLTATDPGCDVPHAASYWAATAGQAPPHDGPLDRDIDIDVAIIGGGYTGLSTAYHLSREHDSGLSCAVLEANQPGWGCSGRNGSFARPAIGRLSHADWIARWGAEEARRMFAESLAALNTVREIIRDAGIACDAQPDGWIKLAHLPSCIAGLRKDQALLREAFGFATEFLDAERIRAEHFDGGEAYGGLRWPVSFAMHPLKLANGLMAAARRAGARVHGGTPVTGWEKDGERHLLRTPGGTVRADRVVVASNGYTLERLFPAFRARLLPVTSNIVVTQPLTDDEIAAGNFRSTDALSDARTLLFYFRRLPDNRIMMGGKGPVNPTPAAMDAHRRDLLAAVKRKFPFMREPRADYFWGGWVAITMDFIPHVGRLADDASVFYALGYMGSGVSFSLHAGRRLAAALATGKLDLPAPLTRPLQRFPLAPLRRVGQRVMMRYYAIRDRR